MIVIGASGITLFITIWARICIQIFSDTQRVSTTATQNSLLIQLFRRPAFWLVVFAGIVTLVTWIKSLTAFEFYSDYIQLAMIMLTAGFLIYKQSFQFYHLIYFKEKSNSESWIFFIIFLFYIQLHKDLVYHLYYDQYFQQ